MVSFSAGWYPRRSRLGCNPGAGVHLRVYWEKPILDRGFPISLDFPQGYVGHRVFLKVNEEIDQGKGFHVNEARVYKRRMCSAARLC